VGLKSIQEEFVKLSLDEEAREKVFGSPSTDLNNFDHLKLGLKRHAYSLIRKRLGVVKSILRNTKAAMGDSFEDEFLKYASLSEVPSGIDRHRKDSIQFAEWLIKTKKDSKKSKALKVLLSHELQPVHMWMSKKKLSIKFYSRSPHQIMSLSRDSIPITKARISPTAVIWWETNGGQSCYQWRSYSL